MIADRSGPPLPVTSARISAGDFDRRAFPTARARPRSFIAQRADRFLQRRRAARRLRRIGSAALPAWFLCSRLAEVSASTCRGHLRRQRVGCTGGQPSIQPAPITNAAATRPRPARSAQREIGRGGADVRDPRQMAVRMQAAGSGRRCRRLLCRRCTGSCGRRPASACGFRRTLRWLRDRWSAAARLARPESGGSAVSSSFSSALGSGPVIGHRDDSLLLQGGRLPDSDRPLSAIRAAKHGPAARTRHFHPALRAANDLGRPRRRGQSRRPRRKCSIAGSPKRRDFDAGGPRRLQERPRAAPRVMQHRLDPVGGESRRQPRAAGSSPGSSGRWCG